MFNNGEKTVAKRLGVDATTVIAAATLVFAVASGPARADDKVTQILSDTQLDTVHAAFLIDRRPEINYARIYDPNSNSLTEIQTTFTAFEIGTPHSNIFQENGPTNEKLWQYFPEKDMLVRLYRSPGDPNFVTYASPSEPNLITFMIGDSNHMGTFDISVGRATFVTPKKY